MKIVNSLPTIGDELRLDCGFRSFNVTVAYVQMNPVANHFHHVANIMVGYVEKRLANFVGHTFPNPLAFAIGLAINASGTEEHYVFYDNKGTPWEFKIL